jgi:hypothetical protein
MTERRRLPLVLMLGVAATHAGCGTDAAESPSVERSSEDGVERVVNRGPDEPLPWDFVPHLRIGPEGEGAVRFTSVEPWEVGADRNGRIYVLDSAGGQVVVFGRSGRLVGRSGRPGQGNGELQEPMALSVTAAGAIGVYDERAGGVWLWGSDGAVPELRRTNVAFRGPELAVTGFGILYTTVASDGEHGRTLQLSVTAPTRAGVLTALDQAVVRADFSTCAIGALPVVPIFEPDLIWAAAGETVVAAAGPAYQIEVFERGVLARRVTREAPERRADRDLALREVANGLELTVPRRCFVPPAAVVEGRGFAATVPAISGLALAPDGTMWLRRGFVRGEAAVIDVLAPDGAYQGTLPAGAPFPAAFAGGPAGYRIVTIEEGDTGEREIVTYQIVRP